MTQGNRWLMALVLVAGLSTTAARADTALREAGRGGTEPVARLSTVKAFVGDENHGVYRENHALSDNHG